MKTLSNTPVLLVIAAKLKKKPAINTCLDLEEFAK